MLTVTEPVSLGFGFDCFDINSGDKVSKERHILFHVGPHFVDQQCPVVFGTHPYHYLPIPCKSAPAISILYPPSCDVPINTGSPTHSCPGPWRLGLFFILCVLRVEDALWLTTHLLPSSL